jgi:DivIVA domain-containing protein
VPLERQSIEKKDFPIGRRGYDPDAVDTHLARIAEEVDELKRSSRRRTETLASSASEQVRAIVEAAENSAAEIQRLAEDEARDIRAEAAEEAQSTRQQATSQAREYVGRVSESTAVMLQRLDAMENELSALVESLKTGSNRLNADLQLLEGNLDEVRGAVQPRARFESEPEPELRRPAASRPPAREARPAAAAYETRGGAETRDAAEFEAFEPEPEPLGDQVTAVEVEIEEEYLELPGDDAGTGPAVSAASVTDESEDETEGARLIALNMALNGTSREETERYLTENFELRNRDELLDEVYSSVEG